MPRINESFWDYLINAADNTEHFWLSDWLNEKRTEFDNISPCKKCKSRIHEEKAVYDCSQHYIIRYDILCVGCGNIVDQWANRDSLRKMLETGNFLYHDFEKLKQAIGDDKEKNL